MIKKKERLHDHGPGVTTYPDVPEKVAPFPENSEKTRQNTNFLKVSSKVL
jgi:hypothetical protein